MHLLILDDNDSLLRALERLLVSRQDWEVHQVTQWNDVRENLLRIEVQAILLDHDLPEDHSHRILQLLRSDFPHLLSKTWLMHGALETPRWTETDYLGVVGPLIKPHGFSELLTWLNRMDAPSPVDAFHRSTSDLLNTPDTQTLHTSADLNDPPSVFWEWEQILRDQDAWNSEIAILLEVLEEKLDPQQARAVLEGWKKKRPIV